MTSLFILAIALLVFFGKKYFHDESIERFANIATIILFLLSILFLPFQEIFSIDNLKTETEATVMYDIPKSNKFEFVVYERIRKVDTCPAKQYSAHLDSNAQLQFFYKFESLSPSDFYKVEIFGPDFKDSLVLQGVNEYYFEHRIIEGGTYAITFSYCAAFTIHGSVTLSEGYWNVIDTEIEDWYFK